MKIAIFGLGYVGITGAACFLLGEGHTVVGVEISEQKSRMIAAGRSPIVETGVDELLAAGVRDGRLSVVATAAEAIADSDIAMVCVGTPSAPTARTTWRTSSTSRSRSPPPRRLQALGTADGGVPVHDAPGSLDGLIQPIFDAALGDRRNELVELVYNPEFLRESSRCRRLHGAAEDRRRHRRRKAISPHDGAVQDDRRADLHHRLQGSGVHEVRRQHVRAVKVAFANEIGRFCVSPASTRRRSTRFSCPTASSTSPLYYTRPGGAFGGSCLPKDVRALQYLSDDTGSSAYLIESLIKSNDAHKRFLYEHATRDLEKGAHVLMVGLAF